MIFKLSAQASFLIIIFIVFAQLTAQAPDTLNVAGNTVGLINKTIMGDTTETGERQNINRVYKLERGKIYYYTATITANFPVTIIADDDDPQNPLAPPLIAPAVLQDNSATRQFLDITDGDCRLKNLYFSAFRPDQQPLNFGVAIYIGGEQNRLVVNNCIFDGWSGAAIIAGGLDLKIHIYDSVFRNMQHSGAWLFGDAFFNSVVSIDSVILVNNTMFSSGSYFFCPNREICNYARIEHNTIFLNHGNPLYAPYLTNAEIKNNLFYGNHAMGITELERAGGWFDWNGEISSLASIDILPTDMAEREGIAEKDRKVNFSNNVYFWPRKIRDFWEITLDDTVYQPAWMNSRTQAMFADDENYPYLTNENNIEVDPVFSSSVTGQVDSLLKFCLKIRNGTQKDYHWWFNPDNDLFAVQWPLPEDLRYQNTDLYTAGDDGFPVGDLNWFPEKKAEWVAVTALQNERYENSVKTFTLKQNYPNPFNPATEINYQLKGATFVKLTIFDVSGRIIHTLVSEKQIAGDYSVTFNAADLPSAVYFYRLNTSSGQSRVRKMVLLK